MAEFNNTINEMPPQKRAGAYKRLYQHIADILSLPSLEAIGAAHENAASLKARVEQLLLVHCENQPAETVGRITYGNHFGNECGDSSDVVKRQGPIRNKYDTMLGDQRPIFCSF
ncbi:hypothetical protein GPALN_012579 [Globodera pallida]|nr:hypothetical protein GPALN_012579 [Globodera pallida]